MTRPIDDLEQIAPEFDVIVLDQWGVLHDGSAPYPGAVAAVEALAGSDVRLAVLSNSGKRAALNAQRIAELGFDPAAFDLVMTSGEALWLDIVAGRLMAHTLFPIERVPGDAEAFCAGLDVTLCADPTNADAILLMGLADDAAPDSHDAVLDVAHARGIPVLCTNPDRASPRASGTLVRSPGALAHAFAAAGGTVEFYGKPHAPIFETLRAELTSSATRLLMVGDSLEHDIAGAQSVGWSTALVTGGLHADSFRGIDNAAALSSLCRHYSVAPPDYTIATIGAPYARNA